MSTEWGVRYSDSGWVVSHPTEESARKTANEHNAIDKTNWTKPFDMQAVSRQVTDWEELAKERAK